VSAARPTPSATLDAVFGALAHPSRRQILTILVARGGVMTAGEIADRFKCSWPTTTRHLGVLEEAGALRVVRRGRNRHSIVATAALRDTLQWLEQLVEGAEEAEEDNDRPGWVSKGYASMRNAQPPGA